MNAYRFVDPKGPRVPIILSVPHCGTSFPSELRDEFKISLSEAPDDTDWFVDRLYDFAPALGIGMITSVFSRWVIDLNRDPEDKPLYSDGRIITGLCPVTNFAGEFLYRDDRMSLPAKEIDRRREQYYKPYHDKLSELILEYKSEFGKVLIWDCHSIRQYVSTIYKDKFPDLVLGDAEGTSASPITVETAFRSLKSSPYSLSHNFPFKGGFITRHYGKPLENQQVLQLEMSKINYLDDREQEYHEERAETMRGVLQKTLIYLSELFIETPDR